MPDYISISRPSFRALIAIMSLTLVSGLACDPDDSDDPVFSDDATSDADATAMDASPDSTGDSGPSDAMSQGKDSGPTDASDAAGDTTGDAVADTASDAAPDTAPDSVSDTTQMSDTTDASTKKGTPCPRGADSSLICGPHGVCKQTAAGYACVCEAGWKGIECRISASDV